MARLYSTLIAATTITSGTPFDYVVGGGFLVIIRDISIACVVPAGTGAQLICSANGVEFAQWFAPGGWAGSVHFEGRVVVPATGAITFTATGGGVWELVASGYALSTP